MSRLLVFKIFAPVAFASGMAAVALGAHAAGLTVLGAGNHSCIEWSDHRAKKDLVSFSMGEWVEGFLFGSALYLNQPDALKNVTPEELQAEMDRICRAFPTAAIEWAAERMTGDLLVNETARRPLK